MTKHRDSLNTADIRLLFDLPRPGSRHLRNPNTKPQKQNPRKGSAEAKQKSRKSFKASLRAAAAKRGE